jgi:general secretion pathway protein D
LIAWFLILAVVSQSAASDPNLVAVDFENVDLRVFIKFVSEVTGRLFLLDDKISGQVSGRVHKNKPLHLKHHELK